MEYHSSEPKMCQNHVINCPTVALRMTGCLNCQSLNLKLFYYSIWGQHWGQLKLICCEEKFFPCKFHIIFSPALLERIAHDITLIHDVGRSTRNDVSSSPFGEKQKKSNILFSSGNEEQKNVSFVSSVFLTIWGIILGYFSCQYIYISRK